MNILLYEMNIKKKEEWIMKEKNDNETDIYETN